MIRFLLRRQTLRVLLAALCVWGVISIAPIFSIVSPAHWGKTHLIVLMNDAEARPCGGFISAYGVARAFPPKFQLDNVYNLPEHSLGAAREPLAAVANQLQFWDTGTALNPSNCVNDIEAAFEEITEMEIDRVMLVNASILERLIAGVGGINFNGEEVQADNAFATLSRAVADTDRHDESALAGRKSSIGDIAKSVIKKSVFQFWNWRKMTKSIAAATESELFLEGSSPAFESDGWALVEWNLGGAKSSRYLQKNLELRMRETAPDEWLVEIFATAHHLGGSDEPLSQTYKGGFEVQFPEWLETANDWWPVEVAPGKKATYERTFQLKGQLPRSLSITVQRGQKLFFDGSISVFPQQQISAADGHVTEGVWVLSDVLEKSTKYAYTIKSDMVKPFVTLHEYTPKNALPELYTQEFASHDIVVEIHFSEPIILNDAFYAELLDRDVADVFIHADAYLDHSFLFLNNQTLLLGFQTDKKQDQERYDLRIEGIEDFFGNEIKNGQRTIIVRD